MATFMHGSLFTSALAKAKVALKTPAAVPPKKPGTVFTSAFAKSKVVKPIIKPTSAAVSSPKTGSYFLSRFNLKPDSLLNKLKAGAAKITTPAITPSVIAASAPPVVMDTMPTIDSISDPVNQAREVQPAVPGTAKKSSVPMIAIAIAAAIGGYLYFGKKKSA